MLKTVAGCQVLFGVCQGMITTTHGEVSDRAMMTTHGEILDQENLTIKEVTYLALSGSFGEVYKAEIAGYEDQPLLLKFFKRDYDQDDTVTIDSIDLKELKRQNGGVDDFTTGQTVRYDGFEGTVLTSTNGKDKAKVYFHKLRRDTAIKRFVEEIKIAEKFVDTDRIPSFLASSIIEIEGRRYPRDDFVDRSLRFHEALLRFAADHKNHSVNSHIRDNKYIVSPFFKGGDLFDMSQMNVTRTDTQVLNFCSQLLVGMGQMHKKNLAHRDIKPENCLKHTIDEDLLRELNDPVHLQSPRDEAHNLFVVCDLGLAGTSLDVCVKNKNMKTFEDTWTPGGTICFAAPENGLAAQKMNRDRDRREIQGQSPYFWQLAALKSQKEDLAKLPAEPELERDLRYWQNRYFWAQDIWSIAVNTLEFAWRGEGDDKGSLFDLKFATVAPETLQVKFGDDGFSCEELLDQDDGKQLRIVKKQKIDATSFSKNGKFKRADTLFALSITTHDIRSLVSDDSTLFSPESIDAAVQSLKQLEAGFLVYYSKCLERKSNHHHYDKDDKKVQEQREREKKERENAFEKAMDMYAIEATTWQIFLHTLVAKVVGRLEHGPERQDIRNISFDPAEHKQHARIPSRDDSSFTTFETSDSSPDGSLDSGNFYLRNVQEHTFEQGPLRGGNQKKDVQVSDTSSHYPKEQINVSTRQVLTEVLKKMLARELWNRPTTDEILDVVEQPKTLYSFLETYRDDIQQPANAQFKDMPKHMRTHRLASLGQAGRLSFDAASDGSDDDHDHDDIDYDNLFADESLSDIEASSGRFGCSFLDQSYEDVDEQADSRLLGCLSFSDSTSERKSKSKEKRRGFGCF